MWFSVGFRDQYSRSGRVCANVVKERLDLLA
jgi:hypothetical protein